MDWMERQIPPPSWHDEGDILKVVDEDTYCPLTSVVRSCYLSHLEQTLLQNYNSCRTQTIHQSTLQDLILHWEQNALRACMVTTIYQKAMRQLINAIKADTKGNKLTSVLTATIKKSQRQHLVDVSTQTESATSTLEKPPSVEEFDMKNNLKRERSVTRESSDGPFLTPPSEYPLPTQTAKKASRRQLPFPPQDAPSDPTNVNPPFDNHALQVPYQFHVPPPGYPFVPQQLYHDQFTKTWPNEHFAVQPISVITNVVTDPQYILTDVVTDPQYEDTQFFPGLPEQDPNQTDMTELRMETLFGDGPTDVKFPLGTSDAAEPDYNWDQIEEEMARLYGQAFTEDDGKAMSDEPEPEPEIGPIVLPKEQDNVDLDLLGALHETQLQSRLEYIRKHWSLERQAKLKRKFIELFGREDDDDQLSQVSAKESAKCKQRIAPWIVKHLMPLYKEKRIASRHLFKSLAKHISDLLIQRNLHPDECDVWMGVQEFFRGGTNIECEADFSA